MQLTMRDVSRLLNVAESTVARWIKQRGLPARQVGGHYRCNTAELLEWATVHRVKIAAPLLQNAASAEEPPPTLVDALVAGGIHYDLKDSTRAEALRALVQVLPLPDEVDRELLLQLFLAREAAASTAVGDGIAIPHVRNPIVLHVTCPTITLAFLERPIDFSALDGRPVYVFFSIVSPTTRVHLQLLSRLSFALQNLRFKSAVTRQAPRDEILRELQLAEAEIQNSRTAADGSTVS
jgi:PTS system nitrogen regulatory IIA component